jgi:hypothetical protein
MLSWRKNNTVAADLANDNWMRGLWRMSTAKEMSQFINLWGLVHGAHLSEVPDSISLRWTAHGMYMAYGVQFRGSYSTFNTTAIWRAQAEGKHIGCSLGCWFKGRCSLLTASSQGTGPVMLSVCCAIRRLRLRSIYAWTAILQGKSGPPCPCGLMKGSGTQLSTFPYSSGGIPPCGAWREEISAKWLQYSSLRLGICGMRGTEGFSMEFQLRRHEFSNS